MRKNKITRSRIDELSKIMPVLTEIEQRGCIGGTGSEGIDPLPANYIPSCVFEVMDYIDGDKNNAYFYFNQTRDKLGYIPRPDGGVKTSDIPTIGGFGGLTVRDAGTGNFTFTMRGGKTTDGENVAITFNKNGIDHMVVVTGYALETREYKVHDPSTGSDYEVSADQVSGIYFIKDRSNENSTGSEQP